MISTNTHVTNVVVKYKSAQNYSIMVEISYFCKLKYNRKAIIQFLYREH